MNTSREDIEKFDAYLQGTMNAEEVMLFESTLLHNEDFNESFELHKLLVSSITAEREQHLREILKEQREQTFIGSNTWSKKFTMVAAAIMLLGISALMISYLKNTSIKKNIAQNDIEKISENSTETATQNEDNTLEAPQMRKENTKEELTLQPASPDIADIEDGTQEDDEFIAKTSGKEDNLFLDMNENRMSNAPASSPSTTLYSSKDADVISTDKLLKTAPTKVKQIVPVQETTIESSATKYKKEEKATLRKESSYDRDDKVNEEKPDTTLKTNKVTSREEKKATSPTEIIIAYYKSPLNYKGYTYSGNKITAYGLKDTVSNLFLYEDGLYLKNAGILYLIKPSPVFTDYLVIKEKNIINLLK